VGEQSHQSVKLARPSPGSLGANVAIHVDHGMVVAHSWVAMGCIMLADGDASEGDDLRS
jgi:hypothetical protein